MRGGVLEQQNGGNATAITTHKDDDKSSIKPNPNTIASAPCTPASLPHASSRANSALSTETAAHEGDGHGGKSGDDKEEHDGEADNSVPGPRD